ncbi:formate hydrogenlyase subunit 4 [bacterium BMS3Bbin12]|nr:formate hydrogenlyase subunit 4 [bacterium BMS3Abin12]GBE48361.1 formate hydrogenlyase subunit 4 [bacterium BMS3Bbin12]GBE50506.1 formate hydrogenlyase subunit 4 [bacterium BMS3Bbin13]HDJ85487.1 formate hydrogenlyase [Chromatiales bacterium]HDK02671.1 formate hydrogenlyase [Gammaproteobacteria bacterium]
MSWALALMQTALFVAGAPLLAGWIKRVKCRLQNRRAPPVTQPYRDLVRLFRKELLLPEESSWLFRAAPYVIFGAMVLAAAVVPLVALRLPTAEIADVIVLVGFFALARFFQALAGMDIGTAFGGMGASREMTIASLAEPALLMAVFTLAMSAGTTDLSVAIERILGSGLVIRPSFVFAFFGLLLVAIAETGRIPVDNPATHLELTMIHEAMVLEYSGRHLALIEWASQIKFMIYAVLITNIFLPWGIAMGFGAGALALGAAAVTVKLAALAALLAVSETLLAKMRLFSVPQFLGFAYLLCLLGMLSHVILEVGG